MTLWHFRLRPSLARAIVAATAFGCALAPRLHAAPRTTEAIDETVSGERIAQVARQRVLDEVAALGLRGNVEVIQTPPDIVVSRGKVLIKVREPLQLGMGVNATVRHVAARIDISTPDQQVRSTTVSLEVTTFGARRAEAVKVPERIEPPLREQRSPATLRSPSRSTESPPRQQAAIRRGDYTTLRAVDGAIQLESRAQALEDGLAGQFIHVRLVNSTDAILAMVTPRGQLELRP